MREDIPLAYCISVGISAALGGTDTYIHRLNAPYRYQEIILRYDRSGHEDKTDGPRRISSLKREVLRTCAVNFSYRDTFVV
jgi:hypothetical protein